MQPSAAHILLSTRPDPGSLKLPGNSGRRAIAVEQAAVEGDAIRSAPRAMVTSAVRNILARLANMGLDMTVPSPARHTEAGLRQAWEKVA